MPAYQHLSALRQQPLLAPLTKMLISLRINKGNIWLAACFYIYRLHKANHLNK
jgi:hypothetical protein